MDIISNTVGGLSPSQFGEDKKGNISFPDLDDKTFSELLEKQLNKGLSEKEFSASNEIFIPSGIDIGIFDRNVSNPATINDNSFSQIKPVQKTEEFSMQDFKNEKDFSTSEILAFFPSLFDSKPTMTQNINSGLFDFERKQAAGSYGKYAKSVVTDLQEFVTDALKMA